MPIKTRVNILFIILVEILKHQNKNEEIVNVYN